MFNSHRQNLTTSTTHIAYICLHGIYPSSSNHQKVSKSDVSNSQSCCLTNHQHKKWISQQIEVEPTTKCAPPIVGFYLFIVLGFAKKGPNKKNHQPSIDNCKPLYQHLSTIQHFVTISFLSFCRYMPPSHCMIWSYPCDNPLGGSSHFSRKRFS